MDYDEIKDSSIDEIMAAIALLQLSRGGYSSEQSPSNDQAIIDELMELDQQSSDSDPVIQQEMVSPAPETSEQTWLVRGLCEIINDVVADIEMDQNVGEEGDDDEDTLRRIRERINLIRYNLFAS